MERLKPKSNARFFALNPAEIGLVVEMACGFDIPVTSTLGQTGLTSATLQQAKSKVTLQQHATVVSNAMALAGDPLMALRLGARVHLTAFGIIGYALWSSSTLGEALDVAAEYSPLLNLKCGPTLAIEGDDAVLYFTEPCGLSAQEKELCTEFEIAKVLTFLRDLQVPDFQPLSIRLLSNSAEHLMKAGLVLGCADVGHAEIVQIRFRASWLNQELSQANPRTLRTCLDACDQLLDMQGSQFDVASSVRSILANASSVIPTLPEVASALCMSARTLRRRLDLMSTSYSQLLDEVRKSHAIRYVSSTGLTTELIAEKLGYSDAANFSHAFKRWTGHAPRQYRASVEVQGRSMSHSQMA